MSWYFKIFQVYECAAIPASLLWLKADCQVTDSFCLDFFGHVEKRLDKKAMASKFMNKFVKIFQNL